MPFSTRSMREMSSGEAGDRAAPERAVRVATAEGEAVAWHCPPRREGCLTT